MGALQPEGPTGEEQGPRLAGTRSSPPRRSALGRSTWRRSRSRRVPRLGNVVIQAKGLNKGFDDRLLIEDLSFDLPRGGIVGIIGPNGVGKTTLFKMIIGEEQPDSGKLTIGETVKIAYVDQSRSGLDAKKNVWEVISDGLDYIQVGKTELPSRAYVSSFGFKGPDQQKPVGVLSGGERNRLNLALDAEVRRQRAAARRADQRPRRRDAALARGRAARVPGLRRGHQPRPLVPRPHRDAHPGVGGHRRGPVDAGTGTRATSPTTRRTRSSGLGLEAARPHRVTYRKLTRD